MLAFAPSGVAKVIEQSARMVSHQNKLATKFRDIVDLIRQSSYWASKNGHKYIQDGDIRQAVEEQIYRSNQWEEYVQEMIDEALPLPNCMRSYPDCPIIPSGRIWL